MPTSRTAGSRAAALGVAALAGAAVAFVAAVDPGEPGHYPPCPFLMLTGLYCPGCGGLRAVHALAHGDLPAALGFNPLVVIMIPVLAALWGRWTLRAWRGGAPDPDGGRYPGYPGYPRISRMSGISVRPVYAWSLLAVTFAFWIARNLPFGEFLAP
ncbi:DUF2752 domain-containing protein [Streptosporangium sp. NPDC050855]|uniref:DUF2752 domain-containing protein n=1 Tax=Streptosporangium sp. NPDC050855 TaxID=3366194 RepID=UPI003792EC90